MCAILNVYRDHSCLNLQIKIIVNGNKERDNFTVNFTLIVICCLRDIFVTQK
jgi:hypothetical protein